MEKKEENNAIDANLFFYLPKTHLRLPSCSQPVDVPQWTTLKGEAAMVGINQEI